MEQKTDQIGNLLTTVVDQMLEGFQVIDNNWRYLYVNDTVVKQGRMKREDLIGKTMMECYHGIENTFLYSQLKKVMDDKTTVEMENEFVYPDNSKGWFQLYIQSCEAGIFILSVDITARKQLEEKLQGKINEIDDLTNIAIDCEAKVVKIKEILKGYAATITTAGLKT